MPLPFRAAFSNTHSQYRLHTKRSVFKALNKDLNIDVCDSWIEPVSHYKNSIWGCSVTAHFVGLEKGIHSLWNPAGLIHEITKITVPPHLHVHKCLLWYLSVTSVQWSPWMMEGATLWDTQGCSPVLTQVYLSIRQPFPCGSVCTALPPPSALPLESQQLARMRAAHLCVICFHGTALRDSPFLLWMRQPHKCESQQAMLSRAMYAWRVWSV